VPFGTLCTDQMLYIYAKQPKSPMLREGDKMMME